MLARTLNQVTDDMKKVVLSEIYSEGNDVSCGQARALMWHKMKKKSTFRLPTDDDS